MRDDEWLLWMELWYGNGMVLDWMEWTFSLLVLAGMLYGLLARARCIASRIQPLTHTLSLYLPFSYPARSLARSICMYRPFSRPLLFSILLLSQSSRRFVGPARLVCIVIYVLLISKLFCVTRD